MGTIKLGLVPYLNIRPLVEGLLGSGGNINLIFNTPAQLVNPTLEGQWCASILPAVVWHDHDWSYLDGPAIISQGPVKTVLLKLNKEAKDCRTFKPDPASRSSFALTHLWFEQANGQKPAITSQNPDVELVIGDPAFHVEHESTVDLGQFWTDLTGLPFVWAFWMGRLDQQVYGLDQNLKQAHQSGLQSIADWLPSESERLNIPHDLAQDYLQNIIKNDMTPDAIAGFAEFSGRLESLGLIETRRAFERSASH